MLITDIRIRLKKSTDEDKKRKIVGVASVTFDDCFVIHDIKIFDGDNGLHIAFPSRKTHEGDFRDIAHPLNSETREYISKNVVDKYSQAAAEASI